MQKQLPVLLFLVLISLSLKAQELSKKVPSEKKPYFVRITMDKLRLGNDSVMFRSPKTIYTEMNAKSDTIEVGAVKATKIGMTVEVQKFFAGKTVRYRIGYVFYKRENNKWVLIKNFGWTDRFSLLKKPDEVKNSKAKKPAHEEFFCSIGEPMQFSASFRMDVYLNE